MGFGPIQQLRTLAQTEHGTGMKLLFRKSGKNRLDLSVSVALGNAAQIALFVTTVLVLLSYVIGPAPMD